MKYFYSIVIDGFSYAEVTETRYKNIIDFHYHKLPNYFEHVEDSNMDDVWDYLDCVGGYSTGDSYVALDENNNKLEDLETPNETFAAIKKASLKKKVENKYDGLVKTIDGVFDGLSPEEIKELIQCSPILKKISKMK